MAQRQYLDDEPTDVQDLIYDGRKLEAIKRAREAKGLGLKEAKEYVESLQARLREAFPGALPSRSKTGCASVILLFAACLAAHWRW